MKVIQKEHFKSIEVMHSFVNYEKKVLLDISHPFIVDTHEIFETSNFAFFIMSFVQGGDLLRCLNH